MEPAKKPWESKTVWINWIIASVAIGSPTVSAWIAAHPDYSMMAMAGINTLLRRITKGRVELW
jgi:hypothetical protein